ncbi:hypothetical protein [uncultured Salinisphaera sp.]
MSQGDLILYRTDDGRAQVHLPAEGGAIWLAHAFTPIQLSRNT